MQKGLFHAHNSPADVKVIRMSTSPDSSTHTPLRTSVQPHPPKVETFDLSKMINIDPKGFHREVDEYCTISPNRLYMRRGMDHPKFGYLESFLLADEGLRISIYHFRPGIKVEHIRYVDIVSIDCSTPDRWHMTDLYLDILQAPRDADAVAPLPADAPSSIVVEDVDELVAAHAQGLISDEVTESAIETALRARADIAANGDHIDAWLSSFDMDTTWADDVELAPAS